MVKSALAAALLFGTTTAHAQAPAGHVIDTTSACWTDAEFSRYVYFMAADKAVAAVYLVAHRCPTLQPDTPIHLEKGSAARETNHVCIRPVGYIQCVWTYAAHIKLD
jgi:hypothetical protein